MLIWGILLLKILAYCRNFTVLSSFLDVKKQKPTMNLERNYQCSVNIEIFLDLKIYFSLVTFKINNYLHSVRPIKSLKFLHRDD